MQLSMSIFCVLLFLVVPVCLKLLEPLALLLLVAKFSPTGPFRLKFSQPQPSCPGEKVDAGLHLGM